MKLWLLITFCCLGLACPARASTVFDLLCVRAYHELYPTLQMNERELLASFDAAAFKDSGLTFLDSLEKYVFAVKDNRGVEYVFRLGSYKQNVPMEYFASRFYRAMGVATPEIRKLTKEERQQLAPLLKEANVTDLDRPISVALRHPAVGGREKLIQLNADGPYREILLRMANAPQYQGLAGRNLRRGFLDLVQRESSPENLDVLYQDLRSVYPKFGDEFRGTIESKIRTYIIYGEGPELAGLGKISLDRIPKDILHGISDGWVLSYALGGGDMHSNNWLAYQTTAFPVDLATPGRAFKRGTDEFEGPRSSLHYPIARELIPGDPQIFFAQHMSPELKAKLQSLTLENLTKIANDSGIHPTTQKMEGVILRVKALLQMAK